MSRSQRITATRLCNRHASDERTSISGWRSHLGWRPKTEMKSEHKTESGPRRNPESGKKEKNRS
jgi:hypothetical protein